MRKSTLFFPFLFVCRSGRNENQRRCSFPVLGFNRDWLLSPSLCSVYLAKEMLPSFLLCSSELCLLFLWRMHDEVSLHLLGSDPFPTMFFFFFFFSFSVLRDTLLIAMSNSLAVLGETCLNTCLTHIWILFAHILF